MEERAAAAAAVDLLQPAVGKLLFLFWKEMLCCDGSFSQISKAKTPTPPPRTHTHTVHKQEAALFHVPLLKVCSKAGRRAARAQARALTCLSRGNSSYLSFAVNKKCTCRVTVLETENCSDYFRVKQTRHLGVMEATKCC